VPDETRAHTVSSEGSGERVEGKGDRWSDREDEEMGFIAHAQPIE